MRHWIHIEQNARVADSKYGGRVLGRKECNGFDHFVGVLALGYIETDPIEPDGVALFIDFDLPLSMDPADLAIWLDDPKFHIVIMLVCDGPSIIFSRTLSVLGMNTGKPRGYGGFGGMVHAEEIVIRFRPGDAVRAQVNFPHASLGSALGTEEQILSLSEFLFCSFTIG